MKKIKNILIIAVLGVLVMLYSFTANTNNTSSYVARDKSCDCTTLYTIDFNDEVPEDAYLYNQDFANCFAWNEFIAVNWPADGSNDFGNPNSKGLVAWENYMTKEVLMFSAAVSSRRSIGSVRVESAVVSDGRGGSVTVLSTFAVSRT